MKIMYKLLLAQTVLTRFSLCTTLDFCHLCLDAETV